MKKLDKTSTKPKMIAIDDCKVMRFFLQRFLSDTYDITIYQSTSAALKDVSEGLVQPDCILTDFYLGDDITGQEFIQQVKAIDPVVPVIVLSGSCNTDQKLGCLKNGAADFVTKPFNPKELDVRITNALTFSSSAAKYRYAV